MKLKEYHPIDEMERSPVEELAVKMEDLFNRADQENIGFVLTNAGRDSMVLCPYRWFEPEYETVEIKIDTVLLEQLKEIITPMGLTPEDLIVQFFRWCINLDTQDEAIAWLKMAKEEYKKHDFKRNLCESDSHDAGAGSCKRSSGCGTQSLL